MALHLQGDSQSNTRTQNCRKDFQRLGRGVLELQQQRGPDRYASRGKNHRTMEDGMHIGFNQGEVAVQADSDRASTPSLSQRLAGVTGTPGTKTSVPCGCAHWGGRGAINGLDLKETQKEPEETQQIVRLGGKNLAERKKNVWLFLFGSKYFSLATQLIASVSALKGSV